MSHSKSDWSDPVSVRFRPLVPTTGVGVSYKISEVMDVRADYDHVSNLGKTDKVTSNMLSFGVAYHF